jgi:hypothetical protein
MKQTLVTIHGVGRFEHDFWVSQQSAVAQHLGCPPPVRPVWWADLVDFGAPLLPALRDRVTARLHIVAQRVIGRPARRSPRLVHRVSEGMHNFVNGVAGVAAYFIPTRQRHAIRQRLRQTLTELTQQKQEIILVSESLGSVIAFDVLRAEADRYRVAAWVTIGCPLRTLVYSGQRRRDLGAIHPHTVRRWLNVYAPYDPIAAPIAPVFPEFPIRDERIEEAGGLFEAHANYWLIPRVAALIAETFRS